MAIGALVRVTAGGVDEALVVLNRQRLTGTTLATAMGAVSPVPP